MIWQDTQGRNIQAHGGCILKAGDFWYWYGENKGAANCPGKDRVDVIGISCYRSADLVNWEDLGLALAASDDEASLLHPSRVVERPKVLYNEKTGKFLMWMHLDNADYSFSAAGVAVADRPEGPFVLKKAFHPNRQDVRDMTLFQDEDGTAYLVHSKDWNKTMNIAKLTEDYADVDGTYVSVMADQEREAPALCRYGGNYYMVTSGCTGWEPNAALYAWADRILGHWKLIDNPCSGPNSRKTFYGQSTCLFRAGQRFYLLLDHWHPDDLQNSGYSILPVSFGEQGEMTVTWTEQWTGPQTE